VVITSSESPEDRAHAFELGATEYFCKPSSLDEFMEIANVVSRAYHGEA
jgi:DNA-binding response OmpR family regulator